MDDGPTTTESNNETTSTTETYEEVSEEQEAEKIYNLLKVAMALTEKRGLAKQLSPYDFEIRYVIQNPIFFILIFFRYIAILFISLASRKPCWRNT